MFPDRICEQSSVVWNRVAERVDGLTGILYDKLLIQGSADAVPGREAAADLLAQKAMEAGLGRFVDENVLQEFMARVEFAGFQSLDTSQTLRELCRGLRSFAELKRAAAKLIPTLEHKVGAQALNDIAPARIRLPNGRPTKIHYERGKPPWIASILQDFFGMSDTPRIGVERMPVVVHLLAPNRRPVQTTRDLAGFWARLYPQVRRELMRKYPKHRWPERP
jgi:ATP-dependent helicase HrpB